MTQNPKYYTPEISEFHVGFEYEYLNEYAKPEPTWQKEKLQLNDWFVHNFEIEKARVKHLDKQDIEELGWKDSNLIGKYQKFGYEGYTMDYMTEPNTLGVMNIITIYDAEEKSKYQFLRTTENDNIIFRGTIRNKSELLTLMKQIGIIK